ncbi:PTS fructose transporter subunit IIABC [Mycoplasmoides alvi]|uniref:PTS fructose transporter subunit IIABC n=1 Tax=Mycoplasmoides alvi TaxID=78580 RepID=UPI000A011B4A|nr:fructose-specific PTS transporter subunit EIIC [Mycoplasmoides alvi]
MKIFDKNYIKLNFDVSSKHDAFEKIANAAFDLKITNDANKLKQALIARENQASTGFEDGIAIPHAKDDSIIKSSVMYVTFKNPVEWEAIDGQKTTRAFVIMMPSQNESIEHLEVLSTVSSSLMNKDFCNQLNQLKTEDEIFDLIDSNIFAKKNSKTNELPNNDSLTTKKSIIAITACPVGVAHTYLAAEKITKAALDNGYKIKVETHGSSGVKNRFTQEDIDNADVLIIAADIKIELDRFANKKIYQVAVKRAIHEPLSLINEAFEKATVYGQEGIELKSKDGLNDKKSKTSFMKHILTGISYMIPFVILGGICIALSNGLSSAIYRDQIASNPSFQIPSGDFLYYLGQIGSIAFTLMIGALGAYIAYSISGRAALAPAFIVSVLGNTTTAIYPFAGISVEAPMGFVGAIIFGFLIGYTVKWINTWRVPKSISSIMPIFVIPLGVGIFYSLLAMFVIGAPISYVMGQFINALKSLFLPPEAGGVPQELGIGISILIGLLIGAMTGFDMGGPINKVAFIACSTLVSSNVYEPMGMMGAAIPIAPLGMGFCTLIFRNKFDDQEKSLGISAIIMGSVGISEGAIPFAISDPKKAIICNVIGSAVAGAIAAGLSVTNAAPAGGLIVAVLGAVGSNTYGVAAGIGFYILSIVIGTAVTCVLYGFLRNKEFKTLFKSNKNDSLEIKNNKNKEFNLNNETFLHQNSEDDKVNISSESN